MPGKQVGEPVRIGQDHSASWPAAGSGGGSGQRLLTSVVAASRPGAWSQCGCSCKNVLRAVAGREISRLGFIVSG